MSLVSEQSAVRPAEFDLQASLELYAQRIAQAEPESEAFSQFRTRWPSRFMELCKMHLSMSIDIPIDFFDDDRLCSRRRAGSTEMTSASSSSTSRHAHGALRWPIKSFKGLRNNSNPPIPPTGLCPPGARNLRSGSRHDIASTDSVNSIMGNVLLLMDLLDNRSYLSVEGLFRKPGSVNRQRLIKQRILSGKQLTAESLTDFEDVKVSKNPNPRNTRSARRWMPNQRAERSPTRPVSNAVNAHDLASCLKGVLYDLPEPVLTKKLLPLYIQVAAMADQQLDDRGVRIPLRPTDEKIITAKQLKALRLLRLLLPDTHTTLLERLLQLLDHAIQFSSSNLMTAESLGTMFGPALFAPRKMPARNLHGQYHGFSKLATLMITQGCRGMSLVPKTFLQDIVENQRLLDSFASRAHMPSHEWPTERRDRTRILSRCSSIDSGLGCNEGSNSASEADSCVQSMQTTSNPDDLPALVTCVSFAIRTGSDEAADGKRRSDHSNETEYAVAELCAAIQALPDSDPRKRRLVQRFNATNGGLTPIQIKPIGELVRKNVKFAQSMSSITRTGRCQSPIEVAGSFLRSNNGISAFKAARNIRSSLRQKLAIRSNVHIPTSVRSAETPLMPQTDASTQDENVNPMNYSDERQPISVRSSHEYPPAFDTPVVGTDRFSPEYDLTRCATAKPRISLHSIDSIADEHDILFCCPLMDVIASPFRKRPLSQERSTMMTHTTPVTKIIRKGKKGDHRGVDPSPARACTLRTAFAELQREQFLDDRDSYAPILFKEERCTRSQSVQTDETTERTTEGVPDTWKHLVQQKLLNFGYRTVAHQNADPIRLLRRSKTMPSLSFAQ